MTKNKLISFLMKKGMVIISLTTAVILWQVIADLIVKDSFLLPSFFTVILSLSQLAKELPLDIISSFFHFVMGVGIAMGIGIPIGAIMGWFRTADRIIDPFVEVLRPIPPLAWIPFAIVWFGLTHSSASFVIFVGAIFPILINTYAGFRGVPKMLVEAAKVLGCTKSLDLMRSVAFPSALPSIAAGVRIAMGIGWMCLVAAEIFGRSSGLGYKLWHYYQLHQMDNVVAYMIILGLIGYLLDHGFRHFIEEKLLRWRVGIVV
jgi:NitT/TauT family transport system permease protein